MRLIAFLIVVAQTLPSPESPLAPDRRPSVTLFPLDAKSLAVDPSNAMKPDAEPTVKLTSSDDGVVFDMFCDDVLRQTAWTKADSDFAFLAVDKDGDGQITSACELVGSRTVPGASNGFSALGKLSTYKRGQLDEDDPFLPACCSGPTETITVRVNRLSSRHSATSTRQSAWATGSPTRLIRTGTITSGWAGRSGSCRRGRRRRL